MGGALAVRRWSFSVVSSLLRRDRAGDRYHGYGLLSCTGTQSEIVLVEPLHVVQTPISTGDRAVRWLEQSNFCCTYRYLRPLGVLWCTDNDHAVPLLLHSATAGVTTVAAAAAAAPHKKYRESAILLLQPRPLTRQNICGRFPSCSPD